MKNPENHEIDSEIDGYSADQYDDQLWRERKITVRSGNGHSR